MSYEKPRTQTYMFKDTTFGGTGVAHQIKGPKGCVGFVREIQVDVETSLVGTTSVPEVNVGISSGDFLYGRYRLGTTAILGYGTGIHSASQEAITGNPPRTLADFAGHVVLDGGPMTSSGVAGGSWSTQVPAGRIPVDATVYITNLAGVGGTPAGGGTVRVDIEWVGQPGM